MSLLIHNNVKFPYLKIKEGIHLKENNCILLGVLVYIYFYHTTLGTVELLSVRPQNLLFKISYRDSNAKSIV